MPIALEARSGYIRKLPASSGSFRINWVMRSRELGAEFFHLLPDASGSFRICQ